MTTPSNGVSIKTPFGELSATGQFVILVILMVGLIVAMTLGLRDLRDSMKADIANNVKLVMLICQERQVK